MNNRVPSPIKISRKATAWQGRGMPLVQVGILYLHMTQSPVVEGSAWPSDGTVSVSPPYVCFVCADLYLGVSAGFGQHFTSGSF
jgi:hypothetical protein